MRALQKEWCINSTDIHAVKLKWCEIGIGKTEIAEEKCINGTV